MADGSSNGIALTAAKVRWNWHRMSALVGVNHGAVTTPLIFATTLLDKDVGYVGSALLYVSTCLSSLFLSVPILAAIGQRRALLLAMLLYSVYAGSFALAAALEMGSTGQWWVFLPGSCVGGFAASLLWTTQGGYLDRSTTAILDASSKDEEGSASEGERRQPVTAKLASIFAVYYLLAEVACKLLSSAALHYDVRPWLVFTACLGAGLLSTALALPLLDLGRSTGAARSDAPGCLKGAKLAKAAALWWDPKLWCLSLTNLTFGFAAAFMNGFVNAAFTKPQLGADFVGFYATATALTAAIASHLCGAAARRFGTKGPLILIGSLCFLAVPLLVLAVGFEGWGYWLIVPYLLQGCGRAVYESTNKGVFADFFPGPQSEGAFANVMMQVTMSFAICFFFSTSFSREVLASIVLTLASLTCPMYLLAKAIRRREQDVAEGRKESQSDGQSSGSTDDDSNC